MASFTSTPRKKLPKSSQDMGSVVLYDPLQRYLAEISQYKLLTREEEQRLSRRIQKTGDPKAAHIMITANLRLVVKIAFEFQQMWMNNLLDLIQEGNIGLLQAVSKFDPYKNIKFSYYASFWIKAYILKYIMDNWRMVKIGTTQAQRKLFFRLKKEKQALTDQGFSPQPKLLANRLGVTEQDVIDMEQRMDGWDASLDAPLSDDSDSQRLDFFVGEHVSTDEQLAKKQIEQLLRDKITLFKEKLTPREREIFELRVFSEDPETLQDIGDRYKISRERVRQIENAIIQKMRTFMKKELPDFDSYDAS